jgi:lipoprotein-releasing system permease protein
VSLGPALFFARRILGLGMRRPEGGRPAKSRGSRYLRGAVIGVALSIVPLVVVLVVSDGMIQGITARYIEVGTYHLQAQPLGVADSREMESMAALLRESPGDLRAFPEYQGYGVAIAGARTAGVALRAVDLSFLADAGTAKYLQVVSGEAKLESTNQILLGEALARNLGVKVGDTVGVVTSKPVAFGGAGGGGSASFSPKVSVFKVRGIVSAGYRELDALWAFVSFRAGSRIFSAGSARAILGIKVERPYGDLEEAREAASSALGADWSVVTWPEAERNVYKSFATTKALLLLVMALAVAVAAINVSSALVMLVLERRRDIAILKSSGASPGFISRVFLLAGLGVGAFGTLIGIGAGSLIAWRINDLIAFAEGIVNASSRAWASLSGTAAPRAAIRILDPAYYLERIPVGISLGELAYVASASLVLCFFASLVPARRASRLPPLEIFRKT